MFMKRFYTGFLLLVIIPAVFSACGNGSSGPQPEDPAQYKDPLLKANQKLVKNEEQQIADLIRRYGWKMQESGTGLRYLIYHQGGGAKAQKGMTAQIRYKVKLINGHEVYNSEKDGLQSFKLGDIEVIRGLDEGVQLMCEGDKAKLIIPSHLAYGLTGDDNKIPGRATLIYDVELLRVY